MKSIWDATAREALIRRVDALDPNAKALWGKFTSDRMLSHLVEAMKMTLGQLPVKPKKIPIRYWPLKQLAIYVAPFKKGLPTAPELLQGEPAAVETLKVELRRLLAEVVAHKGSSWPEHPAFGKLTDRALGVLVWRHMDHHLRQFGA